MLYKDDWDAARKRFEALWNNEVTDRCCIAVEAPREAANQVCSYDYAWVNVMHPGAPEASFQAASSVMEKIYYGGEAFPQIWFNYGAAGHAAYYGCRPVILERTVWLEPCVGDIRQDLKFDPESPTLHWQRNAAVWYAKNAKGKCLVSTPDNAGSLDALAVIRGTENLLIDLIEEPHHVEAKLNDIIGTWKSVNDELYETISPMNDGGSSIGWLSIWAPGKFAQLQSDISVMLSRAMFDRFVLPEIEKCAAYLDFSLYHMDGVEQIKHLDCLLAVKKLGMIQWVSVAGQPNYIHHIDVFHKIQKAGKGLLINDVRIQDVEKLLLELSPKGLLLMTRADSPQQANELLRSAVKWSGSRQ